MSIFKKNSNNSENKAAKQKEASDLESAAAVVDSTDDKELAAVIMASLMSFMDVHSSSDLKIKSIKRIGRNAPVWNTAGRDSYIASKL